MDQLERDERKLWLEHREGMVSLFAPGPLCPTVWCCSHEPCNLPCTLLIEQAQVVRRKDCISAGTRTGAA